MSEVLELTKALVKRQSITPLDEGCQDLIATRLKKLGFKIEHFPFGEVSNLWATYGKGEKTLTLLGHTDVVPTGPIDKWKNNPFEPTERGGLLFGRGTADMKGSVASFVIAAEEFCKKNPNPKGRLSIMLTSDEEGPAINGVQKVIKHLTDRGEKIDWCLVGEPTSENKLGDVIKIGRRGSINGVINIKGIQGHTANAFRAENPVHHLLTLLHNIISNPLDNGNEHFLPSSIQIPTFDVDNSAPNVIPEVAKATINIRFNNNHTGESLVQWLKDHIANYFNNLPNTTATFIIDQTGEPFLNQPGKLCSIVSSACGEINGTNKGPELATDGGTSDARFIKDYCEVAELGIRNQTLHQIDEFVYLSDIEALQQIYFNIIKKFFKKN